jgi:pimeloyl-ACP methyl ester carboxylesterase
VIGIEAGGTPTSSNFLVRTQALWVAQGFAVAIMGAPDGRPLLGLRHTPYYAAAIDRAADFARSRANGPVWLVGTSQGSTAAVNGGAHLGGKVAGVVLTSSVTQRSRSGETVFEAEPGLITAPVLVVANQGDACRATPPADAAQIVGALTRAVRKEVIVVSSTAAQEGPCDPLSPHGYLGIEAQVVQRISDWIRANPGR